MVALVLYYVEKFLREGYKIFGLDMSQKILPDTLNSLYVATGCKYLYCMKIKVVPKSKATIIRGLPYFL